MSIQTRNELNPAVARLHSQRVTDWQTSTDLVDYERAVAEMQDRVAAIRSGEADDSVWLLEHPPLYTAGTSADDADLIAPDRFPVHRTGRGGQFTYHGPGQRIAYVMLNLKQRSQDVRAFVAALEEWIIATCYQAMLRIVH